MFWLLVRNFWRSLMIHCRRCRRLFLFLFFLDLFLRRIFLLFRYNRLFCRLLILFLFLGCLRLWLDHFYLSESGWKLDTLFVLSRGLESLR